MNALEIAIQNFLLQQTQLVNANRQLERRLVEVEKVMDGLEQMKQHTRGSRALNWNQVEDLDEQSRNQFDQIANQIDANLDKIEDLKEIISQMRIALN